MGKVKYQGLFFDAGNFSRLRAVEGDRQLSVPIPYPHITFAFNPSVLFSHHLLGKEYEVRVIGYGNDGQNSGFEVSMSQELMDLHDKSSVFHITASISKTGKAVNTGSLVFQEIDPFVIRGKLGYFLGNRVIFVPVA